MKTFLHLLILFLFIQTQAQIVGTNVYLQGNRVELGISECGSFGTHVTTLTPVPAGYHNNLAGNGLGFVADAGKNGWSTPGPGTIPNYCGDYFLPGSPVEGWALQIDSTNYRNGSVCASNDIPGSIISYYTSPRGKTAVWRSAGLVDGKIRVTATTFIPDTGMAIITKVELCNESPLPALDVYYLRHVDPDNDQPWPGGSFNTSNTNVSQGNISGTALVSATSLLNCYLGLGSVDSRARVSHGGFSLPPLSSDVYNGVTPFSGIVGSTTAADEAISLCFKIPVIEGYSCECVNYAYILNSADIYTSLDYTDPILTCGALPDTDVVHITGKTYYDLDKNCSFSATSDYAAPYQIVRKSDGTGMALTDMDGNYNIVTNTIGTLSISVDSTIIFNTTCPDSGYYLVTIDSTTDSINHLDFADTIATCYDPLFNISTPFFRPCFLNTNYIYVSIINPFFYPIYGLDLTLHLNDSIRIDSAFDYVHTYLGGNNYSIAIPDTILPFGYISFAVPVYVGCDSVGVIYSYDATLTGMNFCDSFIVLDTDATVLRTAIDPNEKLVRIYNDHTTSYEYNDQIDSLSELEYLINFQNSGSISAVNVKIHDLIDGLYLDPNSIVLTGSSHPVSFTLDHNKLDFYFNDINLPNGPESDPRTHGYVSFRIKQRNGNIRGTQIYNKANIIFDFNAPIVTNFAISTISRAPNTCTVSYNQAIVPLTCMNDVDASITLTPNTLGTYTYHWSNGMNTASITNLAAGTYTVTISNNFDLGCNVVRNFTINNPLSVFSDYSVANKLTSCSNRPDASIVYTRNTGTDTRSFNWSNGASGTMINNLNSGTYTVTVCNSLGCCETNSYTVTSVPAPSIHFSVNNDTVCIGDSVTITATGAVMYTWELDHSTNNSLTTLVSATTTYLVTGENAENCVDSNEITIYAKTCNVGINEVSEKMYNVYPIPSTGIVNVVCNESIKNIEVINIEGKIIRTIKDINNREYVLNLNELSSGIYYLKSYTTNTIYNRKIVIK